VAEAGGCNYPSAKASEMIPKSTPDIPACPNCGEPMRLARTIPKLGDIPELKSWGCAGCGVHFTGEHTALA
jgi:ribosomal protein L37AE/L43A